MVSAASPESLTWFPTFELYREGVRGATCPPVETFFIVSLSVHEWHRVHIQLERTTAQSGVERIDILLG